ncbi:MAG: peptidase M42, partial [Myxococcota bacterium]
MPEKQFKFMRDILAAPSPVGLEAAMTYGVIKPMFDEVSHETWSVHQFAGNAGIVLDTHPGRHDLLTVMLVGHADKIRMQVRSIAEDGKVYINTDSFLPSVLLGHEVSLFSEHPDKPGTWRVLEGGTVEALGAIHFADA